MLALPARARPHRHDRGRILGCLGCLGCLVRLRRRRCEQNRVAVAEGVWIDKCRAARESTGRARDAVRVGFQHAARRFDFFALPAPTVDKAASQKHGSRNTIDWSLTVRRGIEPPRPFTVSSSARRVRPGHESTAREPSSSDTAQPRIESNDASFSETMRLRPCEPPEPYRPPRAQLQPSTL
jgi:hypothetical protein